MKLKDWDFNLKVRLAGEGLHSILFWMFFPFMAIYFSNVFGKELAGLLLIFAELIGVVVGLFGGYWADYFGRKRMMVYATAGEAFSFVLFAIANSPWIELPVLSFVSFAFMGLSGAIYTPASHAMVADVVPEKDRSAVFAVFYTMINISVVIGPVLGGIFFFSYRFEFLVFCFLITSILMIVLQKLIRETAPPKKKRAGGQDIHWTKSLMSQLSDYKVISTDKTFLLFIVAGILVAQTFMQLDLVMAVYTTEFIHEQTLFSLGNWSLTVDGRQTFSWILAENGFLVALFTLAMTKWMTKYKERNVFVISAVLYGVAIILFGHTVSIGFLLIATALFTAAELMVVGLQESFVSRLAPEHMRGQYFAASSLRFTIGRTIAPISIPMTVWFGFSWTFIILGILAFLSAGLYYILFNQYDARQRGKEANTVIS
ncbi:MDR family MFS transporter [Tuberibacillus sp. Marseille-P3662]|uniref:MDR family MFS transporter n=1 Tax=Tuberibacillus sp. Marseille-P3662 TaxID=1965358 RepID=UPI000A1C9C6E|nr:MFS transporter [Tuberibacillus sp. Marseille-P3662]